LSQALVLDPVYGCLYVVPTIAGLPTSYASLQTFANIYLAASTSGTGVSLYINNTGATAIVAASTGSGSVTSTVVVLNFVSNGANNCLCQGSTCKAVCPIAFTTTTAGILAPAGTVNVSPFTISLADVSALASQPYFNSCNQKKFNIYSVNNLSAAYPTALPSSDIAIFVGKVIVSVTSAAPLTVFAYSVDGCRIVYPADSLFVEDCTCEPTNTYVFGPLGTIA